MRSPRTAIPAPLESHVVIAPARNVSGVLRMPGDKSISHRYAMLAAIAAGTSRLHNYSTGQDCASTLSCLRELGCEWNRDSEHDLVTIVGDGPTLDAPKQALDCGNSGSTMRMLSGILAGQEFNCELIGDESLSRRPMARIMLPLTEMGAQVFAGEGQRPPLQIRGAKLRGIDYTIPVPSAQVKTCLLFAGLLAQGITRVSEPVRTRDHGELALRAFGAEVQRDGNRVSIQGGQLLQGIEATVPGDISSAAFFLCAAALFPGSKLTINGLLMNPTRARLLDFLTQLGMKVSVVEIDEHHGELVGTVEVNGGALTGISISGADSATLIDELPVLAAIAPYTRDGVEIRDASELRVKESDRIAVVAQSLRAMGARVEERPDGVSVPGGQTLHGAEIDSHGDHRIAMAFAIAALRARGETHIANAGAADVSYPGFFRDLESVAQR
jgi:3-phosphoshikimate 1-carboxyvinyltransferase